MRRTNFGDFKIQRDHLISVRWPDFMIAPPPPKKKRNLRIVDFAVPADHRIKLKEIEKGDIYQVLARELKNLWNMKVTVILIVIGALWTTTNGLLKGPEDLEIRGQVETIQISVLLRSARILRWVLETCCYSNSSGKPSANTSGKNSKKKNEIMIIIIIINIIGDFECSKSPIITFCYPWLCDHVIGLLIVTIYNYIFSSGFCFS